MNQNPENKNVNGFPYGVDTDIKEQNGAKCNEPQNEAEQAVRQPFGSNGGPTMPPPNPNGQPPFSPDGRPMMPPYAQNGQPFGQPPVDANGQPLYPPFNQQQKKSGSGMSIAGFVLSIVSLVCCCLGTYVTIALAVLGLVFSIIGVVSSKKTGKANGLAVAGIVISSVSLVLWVSLIVVGAVYGEVLEEYLEDYYRQFGYEFGDDFGMDI